MRRQIETTLLSSIVLLASVAPSSANAKISVPSDPNAKYFDEGTAKGAGSLVQIHTRRIGKSGVSHAIRQINCKSGLFKYIYDEDNAPTTFPMSETSSGLKPLSNQSISWWVSKYTCQKLGHNAGAW